MFVRWSIINFRFGNWSSFRTQGHNPNGHGPDEAVTRVTEWPLNCSREEMVRARE